MTSCLDVRVSVVGPEGELHAALAQAARLFAKKSSLSKKKKKKKGGGGVWRTTTKTEAVVVVRKAKT